MSLRFIYGRSGSKKSSFCLNSIKDKEKAYLLVPEQFSFQSEKSLIEKAGENALLKASVISFKKMITMVLNEVGGLTVEHLNGAGRSMLLYKIIKEEKNNLLSFNKSTEEQGFIKSMGDMIKEFKNYDISVETLKASIDKIEDNENLKNKLRDLSIIYEAFEKKLHKSYIDAEDELSILSRYIEKSTLFDDAEIFIDEFSSFTPLQYKVIEELMKKAKRVNVTLCTDSLTEKTYEDVEYTDVFFPVKVTESKLLKIAEKLSIKYEKPIFLEKDYDKGNKEIDYLEKHFFSYPYRIYKDKVESINIFKASNMYSEIEHTAKEIVKLCRDKGCRFNDIAVVTRNLGDYEKLISVIFKEYDIPFFIDKKREIESNPVVITINAALEILNSNWSYEWVFRYLKTGIIDIDIEEIDLIENFVLKNGIRGSRWTDDKPWTDGEEEREDINEIRKKIVTPLVALKEDIKENNTVKGICTSIYNFLINIGVYERLESLRMEFKKSGEQDIASQYAQIWNIILKLFDQMVEVLGDETISLKEFVRILKAGIGEYKIGIVPPTLDQVLVGSIERVKSHQVCVLFILGVNDGVFPKSNGEEGILSDSNRKELRDIGVELSKDTKWKAFEEQFLIYNTLNIGKKYLWLSYPIADMEGKTLRPSIIISRFKKIFKEIEEKSDIIKKYDLELINAPAPTLNELMLTMRRAKDSEKIEDFWVDTLNWFKENELWRNRCDTALKGLYHKNKIEEVKEKKVKKLYGENIVLSASQLERYKECPFSYYIQYGLKAKERKIYKFTSPDLGTFMHSVLYRFSKILDKKKLTYREVTDSFIDETVSILVEDLAESKEGSILNSSNRYMYIKERLKKVLVKSISLIAYHIKNSGFNPTGFEVPFPPLNIELPSGEKVTLLGRIDRVDEMTTEEGTFIRIVDYKSGGKIFKLSDVYYGLQFQLLLYLYTLLYYKERYEGKKALPGAVLYFKLDDPIISGGKTLSSEEIEKEIMKKLKMNGLLLKDARVIKEMDRSIEGYSLIIPANIKKDGDIGSSSSVATKEQFDILKEYINLIITDICTQILQGKISIEPYKKTNKSSCDYCKFSAICGFDLKIEGNRFKYLRELKDYEVWELLDEKIGKGQVIRDEEGI